MKLKIDNAALADAFFEDARLMGIVAPIAPYQFCWQLNQTLGFRFRLNADAEIQLQKKNRQYFFSLYEYLESNGFTAHYLYHNHFDGEYLLPEFKHLDFLWLTKGDTIDDALYNHLIQTIKIMHAVQLVSELHPLQVKHKANLIF
jgi:hypothetical protein